MNILYYISGFDGCGYYRVQMIAKYLNKMPDVHAKISTQYNTEEIDWADIVVVQKQTKLKVLEFLKYARTRGKKIVSECDDDYFHIPPSNPAHGYFKDKKSQVAEFYKYADALTVSTEHLKEVLKPYNDTIYVLPNSLDIPKIDKILDLDKDERFRYTKYITKNQKEIPLKEAQERLKGKLTIGWGGSPTHLKDIEQATPALIELIKDRKDIVLVMHACTTDKLIKAVPEDNLILLHPSPIFKYHQVLSTFNWDIGICPIEDNLFNHSKSNLKFLEFSVFGYPCIASEIENYKKTITDGKTGLLAFNTKDSWYNNLKTLVESASLRETISKNAKEYVRRDFNIQTRIHDWYKAYKEIL